MTPDQYCQHLLARHGSSTHYSLLFLAPEQRRAATALFALSRELDDAVEGSADPGVAHARLAWWMQELVNLFDGTPQHPITRALAPFVATYDLALDRFVPALQARHRLLEMPRFADFEALRQHCYSLSGVFGEMAARMSGSRQATTWARGGQLALGVRMIRLMRDAGRHARAGRSVFPVRDLNQFRVTPDDLVRTRYVDGFEALMQLQASRARQALAAAFDRLEASERRTQHPAIILGALYEALLRELERSRFQVLHQRIALTPLRKLMIACRTRALGPPSGSALT